MQELHRRVAGEVEKVVVGQGEALEVMLAALALGGHVLLEGPPGVAKTLLANATARALGLDFRRIQFTPDMLPSDVTGTVALRGGELRFRPGAGVRQPRARRRDQPHAAQDAGRAAGGDAGGAGHGRRRAASAARTRSSSSRRRTPSSTRAPTRCPRPSATASSCASTSDYPSEEAERAMLRLARRGLAPAGLDDDPAGGRAREELRAARAGVDATQVAAEVLDYVAARRAPDARAAERRARREPARRRAPARRREGRGAARGPRLRDARRRRPHGAAGAAPPARAHARGRAGALHAGERGPRRARRGRAAIRAAR